MSQLKELVAQNENHPSVCFWVLSNEITLRGDSEELLANVGAFGPITAIRTMQPPVPLMEFILQVGNLPTGSMRYINSELDKIPKD